MLTQGEMIYKVKEQTDKHHISDNTGFTDQQILEYLLDVRSKVLHDKQKHGRPISMENQMTTPCINLIQAKDCPCVIPSDCVALVTELLIPEGIGEIISATNPYDNVEYIKTKSHLAKYRNKSRFDSFNDNTSYFENDTGKGKQIFVISKKPLKTIKITLIPRNPEDVYRMLDCSGKNEYECTSSFDIPWKADPDLNKICVDETVNTLLRTKVQYTDNRNDNNDNNVANKQELQ